MKNALISPNEQVSYLSGWTGTKPYQALFTIIPESARIAEVSTNPFAVADPLFWVSCSDEVVTDLWYYDTSTRKIVPVPEPAAQPADSSNATATPSSGSIPAQVL